MAKQWTLSAVLVAASAIISGCGGNSYDSGGREINTSRHNNITCTAPYEYTMPSDPEFGIRTAHVADKAVDADRIIEMLSSMHCGGREHQLHSLLVMIGGELVAEMYFPGYVSAGNGTIVNYQRETLHGLASVQKSVSSALIGIAVEEGYIDIDNDALHDYFPDYTSVDWFDTYQFNEQDFRKADISVRDLLTMSAGFDWDESSTHYGDPRNSLRQMTNSGRGLAYLFERDLVAPPGERFQYNTGLSNSLEHILQVATGETIQSFAENTLFAGLGIENYWWEGGLALRPRDMLKFGELYLRGGLFEGVQVLPAWWVEQSMAESFELSPGERIAGYGFQWWISDFTVGDRVVRARAGLGYGGQQIYVFDEFDTVVVFTAAEFNGQHGNASTTYSWMLDYIVPALLYPEGVPDSLSDD